MNCHACNAEMTSVREQHVYSEDPRVILMNVIVNRCTDAECGENTVEIPDMAHLHRIIAQEIARHPARLTPGEARWLRAHLGYSTVDYAELIGETGDTVLAWEDQGVPIPIDREQQLRMMVLTHPQALEYAVPVRQMPSYSVDDVADSDVPAGMLLEIMDGAWGVPRRVA